MSDGTPVRCLDCGHEWETVAEYPQCSDPDDKCGRSRNVEPVSEIEGGERSDTGGRDTSNERDPSPSGDSQGDSSWSPLFNTEQTETDPVEDVSVSEPPEIEDADIDPSGPSFGGEDGDETDGDSPEMSAPELEPEDIELFIKTPFDMAAKTRGDHWELGDDELNQLSVAYCRVGNKYMPYLMAEHAPEIMACLTTAAVVGPRLAEDREQAEEQERQERAEQNQSEDRGDRRRDSMTNAEPDNFAYDAV